MIINIDETRAAEAAQYVNHIIEIKEYNNEACENDYEKILNRLKKRIQQPNDEVLICTENNKILGVLALIVIPEDKYLEATDGVYAEENYQEVAMQFYNYMKDKYSGFHFDTVYSHKHKEAISFMESIRANCNSIDLKMKLEKDNFKPSKENKEIIPLSEKYYEDFCKLHDEEHKNVYWTGKRLLLALDKVDILIALDTDKLVGSVVSVEYGKKKAIDFIETDKYYRNQGYAKSLLGKSINEAFLSGIEEVTLDVETDNTSAMHLYESFGFHKTDTTYTYSIESI